MQKYNRYIWLILGAGIIYGLLVNPELAEILAGVAILLMGMTNLSAGFKSFSGGLLEKILKKSTDTRIKSIAFGTIATVIMQSSTLVSIITLSFLSAGLVTLAQGIGVVFGANLGNSAGSWIIVALTSVNISQIAIPLIVCGIVFGFQKDSVLKGLGTIFLGIGFFFLGVDFIKSGFEVYKDIIDLGRFNFDGFKGVLIFVGLGTLMTGIVQSSHASLAIVIAALVSNQIGFENALAAILGTSVGGVVTAVVASLSTNIDGKKLALANCVFNFTIAIIVIIFFPYFVQLLNLIADLIGIESVPLKVALWHTLFNLVAVLLISAFIKQIVMVLDKVVKAPRDRDMDAPLYLDPNLVEYPDTAIEALVKECQHLYTNAYTLIAHTIGFNRSDIAGKDSFDNIIAHKKWFSGTVDLDYLYTRKIEVLFEAIVEFSTKTQGFLVSDTQQQRVFELKIAARNLSEATRGLKQIQANMKIYSASQNLALREQYNIMRKGIGELLRSVEELKTMKDENAKLILKQIANSKNLLKERDYDVNFAVETLVDSEQITAANGTAILTDSALLENIVSNVLEAVVPIFTKQEWLEEEAKIEASQEEHQE